MPNRLADQSSPYLLQHQDNPVDWYPWNDEALSRARQENKPIFLSIGYSACHWCHVMEHESFEDTRIAELLNDRFINIKVDREERPDLDQIYMDSVQAMTGHGGWPMSVFLTPDGQPFFAGTYFPPSPRMNMPSFEQVIMGVDNAWQNRQDKALEQAAEICEHLGRASQTPPSRDEVPLSLDLIDDAVRGIMASVDRQCGGFGTAPKFPHAMTLRLMLNAWARTNEADLLEQIEFCLTNMAAGGIYDHIGGGFARYTVDRRWLVPHFEKMLYDNALLTGIYLDAFLATGNPVYRKVVVGTIDYIVRDMTNPDGGFYSSEDADSEGEEGKFYVWTVDEIKSALGDENAELFCAAYDITEKGNFEGKNIPNLLNGLQVALELADGNAELLRDRLEVSRDTLFEVRKERIHPGKDDKILANWNGLMIDAMARAGLALDRTDYVDTAIKAAQFLLDNLMKDDRLLHSYRQGVSQFNGYLDDYACLANSLVTLYEVTADSQWLKQALTLCKQIVEHFHDDQLGGFFYTSDDHESLIFRNKDAHDSSVPSGTSMATTVLLRLGILTGNQEWITIAEQSIQNSVESLMRAPLGFGQMLLALDFAATESTQLAMVAADKATALSAIAPYFKRFIPARVIGYKVSESTEPSLEQLFEGRDSNRIEATLFVCNGFTCQEPWQGIGRIHESCDTIGRGFSDNK